MNLSFKKGQRVVIELTSSEVYEGDYVSGSSDRIDLNNIIEFPGSTKIRGTLCFYKSDLRSVNIVDDDELLDSSTSKDDSKSSTSLEQETPTKETPKVILLCKNEFERLKDMMFNHVYMATTDRRYKEAIEHLNNCENIGVVGLGSQCGRSHKLKLLILSSWDQVYIFDILSYGRKDFEPDLKELLESPSIKKVVHDSRGLVDCLTHCHKVNMENIFDTQVADIMITKSKTGKLPEHPRSLAECLSHYFNLPSQLVEKAEGTDLKKWQERPLTDARKKRAAILGVYLMVLKNKLEDIMLEDFYSTVKAYSTIARDSTGYNSILTTKRTQLPEGIFK